MKSNTKAQNKALSMKDALSDMQNLKVIDNKSKLKDWRDPIWNYPLFLSKLFRSTTPFSYILLYIFLSVAFAFFLQSSFLISFLNSGSKTKDTYTEGTVGAISTFNPLFASANYVDKAIDSLVFQRFVYIDKNGKPLSGVAKSWSVSSNSLEYTFSINNNLYWQDGTPLTMDDVLFTFQTAVSLTSLQNVDSVGVALEGVSITKVDDSTIKFVLKEANPTFFEAVSMYIVPKKAFDGVGLSDIQFNSFYLNPLGSGKYMVEKTEKNVVYLTDNPYDQYNPRIKNIVIRIYPDYSTLESAFRVGSVDALGGVDSKALAFMDEYSSYGVAIETENYRNRQIFMNMRKDNLKSSNIRIGLIYLTNKAELLNMADISGKVMQGPYPDSSWAFNSQIDYYNYDPTKAQKYLNDAGYTKNSDTGYYESSDKKILSFTLSYFDNDINNRIVDSFVKLMDKEGIVIKPEKLNYEQITQEVIPTRDFELLLYEVETTVDPDQYNLWHSLKTNHPGLNLSGYDYERSDILLEDARKTTDQSVRRTKYLQFQKYLMSDAPVIFLYHPNFIFYFDSNLKGVDLSNINFSYERYWNIENWYWTK